MSALITCWHLESLTESEAESYFSSDRRFTGIGHHAQVSCTFSRGNTMSIRPRKANSISKTDDGFVTAELVDITETTYESGDTESEQLLFDFLVPGAIRPVVMKMWTGITISPDKNWVPRPKAKPELNKLSQLCIGLGLLTESELSTFNPDDLGDRLEALKGASVKFKTIESAKNRGLSQIDLKTLQLVK